MRYPDAARLDLVDDLHGHRVADPYRWLEDDADPRTVAWSEAQDALAGEVLSALPMRPAFTARLEQLVQSGTVGVPVWRGGRAFSTRRDPGQEHAVLRVREADGTLRVLVDPTELDPAGTTTLDAWSPSWEGDRLAYQLSTGGDEESKLYVLDVATGKVLDGPIDRCRYSPVAWLPGGDELFYVRRLAPDQVPAGEEQFHRRVWRHRVGAAAGTDGWSTARAATRPPTSASTPAATVAGSSSPARPAPPRATTSGSPTWPATASSASSRSASTRRPPRGSPATAACGSCPTATPRAGGSPSPTRQTRPPGPRGVAGRRPAAGRCRPLRRRPRRRAPTARCRCSPSTPSTRPTGSRCGPRTAPAGWRTSRAWAPAASPASAPRRRAGRAAWVGYTDYATPPSVLRWDAGSPTTLDELGAGRRRRRGAGADRRRDTRDLGRRHARAPVRPLPGGPPDVPRPTVLYGYGGFNVSLTPAYSAQALAWVAAGGVWAVANLRGGSEHGEEWHRAGMRERKQNVFDDFAAAAEHLVAEGWTTHRPARDLRRLERRPAGRRHAHPAAGAGRGRRLQRAAAGHGPVRAVRAGPDLERRVRHRRGPDRARLAARLLAVPRGPRGDGVPGGPVHHVRVRHPGATRCTAASWPPPCSTRPRRRRRSCCGGRHPWATARGR